METSKKANLQNPKLTKPAQHRLDQEALSLRDLPINNEQLDSNATTTTTGHNREPSTEPFEFLTTISYDVSPAENIIFGGKLIPLNHQNALTSLPDNRICPRIRARSAIQSHKLNRPGSIIARENARLMRTSPSPSVNISPAKNTVKPETPSFGSGKSVRPRWYVIMFGTIKFPPEIELKDIKNRQIRRDIPPILFPSHANRRSRKSRSPSPSWRYLNALSCKEPTSVAATVPFRMSHM